MAQKSSQKMTWVEFVKKYSEHKSKPKKKIRSKQQYICQCKNGHVFDYRERDRHNLERYPPCQGKCPVCGVTFSSIGNSISVYPVKYNYLI